MQLTPITQDEQMVQALTAGLRRAPGQLNQLQESDAELIRLPGTGSVLAVTTDQIVEEIQVGLYDDPYLIGWMSVLVSASDLAAVGAAPLGVLLNLVIPPDANADLLRELRHGVRDATEATSLPLLGGDTNHGDTLSAGTTALGTFPEGEPLTRCGAEPGHLLYTSGLLGLGSAYAWHKLGGETPAPAYQPAARLAEGALIRRFASAAIDTSDGALAALDILTQLNNATVVILAEPSRVMHPEAESTAQALGVPDWTLLAGPHGEFELLFTVAPWRRSEFLRAASDAGMRPIEMGRVVAGDPGQVRFPHHQTTVDTTEIRRAQELAGQDPQGFLEAVLAASRRAHAA